MTARLVVLCLLAFAATAADAQTRYVSDRLEVTLRTGTSTQHSIVRMLPSGTRLEVLETEPASGYARVRTADGVEGWVLSRYLMDQPAAREQLAAANRRVETLNARVAELTAEVEVLAGERGSLGRRGADRARRRGGGAARRAGAGQARIRVRDGARQGES
jgi:SH3 domain protein